MTAHQEECPRRRWGKTELSIPVIPFGTQGFGDNFGPVSDDEAMDLIRYAVDRGINHFDCARCYGNSLRKLGLAIKEGVVKRDELIISGRICCHSGAKWGGYGEGEPDYSASRVLEDTEDQLAILGIDSFDVLFIHDPGEISPTLAPGGTLEGLEQARERHWTNFIGYGMNPHDFHLEVIESGRTDALLTFSDFNLLRNSAADTILPAAAKDLGVINGWSIMRGWLTGKPVESFVPRDRWDEDHIRAESMREWCEATDINMLSMTLQFCLRETRIHGNPIGSLNKAQLDANIRAAQATVSDSEIDAFIAANL
ncbi:MAG: aldo/keto reductase [Candidatus Latescibacteria bacterium]|nr:aldo/keto reductase [Candidatus Latescibacterota bacterium]